MHSAGSTLTRVHASGVIILMYPCTVCGAQVQIVQPMLPPPSPRSYTPRSYATAPHPRVPIVRSDGHPPPNFLVHFEADRVPSVGDQPLPPRSATPMCQHTTRAMATTRALAALKKVDVQMYS